MLVAMGFFYKQARTSILELFASIIKLQLKSLASPYHNE